jgi:molybdopterin converting factor small subunit
MKGNTTMTESNLSTELDEISNSVDQAVNDQSASVETLKTLQTEILGYKPLGRLRQLRASLYSALNAAPGRSEEKKNLKAQIATLRTLEDTIANRIDEALQAARDRKRAAREARQAQESPVTE